MEVSFFGGGERDQEITFIYFIFSGNIDDVAECISDLHSPDFHADIVNFFVMGIFEKDKDRDAKIAALLKGLGTKGAMTGEQIGKG